MRVSGCIPGVCSFAIAAAGLCILPAGWNFPPSAALASPCSAPFAGWVYFPCGMLSAPPARFCGACWVFCGSFGAVLSSSVPIVRVSERPPSIASAFGGSACKTSRTLFGIGASSIRGAASACGRVRPIGRGARSAVCRVFVVSGAACISCMTYACSSCGNAAASASRFFFVFMNCPRTFFIFSSVTSRFSFVVLSPTSRVKASKNVRPNAEFSPMPAKSLLMSIGGVRFVSLWLLCALVFALPL